MPDNDGNIRADHFRHMQEQGYYVDEMDLPDIPVMLQIVFKTWIDLHNERPNSGMGDSALSSKFIYDYYKVHFGEKPMSIEIDFIKAIDSEYLKEAHGRHRKLANKSR